MYLDGQSNFSEGVPNVLSLGRTLGSPSNYSYLLDILPGTWEESELVSAAAVDVLFPPGELDLLFRKYLCVIFQNSLANE